MTVNEILFSKFSEPALIIAYKDGNVRIVDMNDKFMPEIGANFDKNDFIKSEEITKSLNEENKTIFLDAIRRCVEHEIETTCEVWLHLNSCCCGENDICLRNRFVYLEKEGDETIIYEAVRNITGEREKYDSLMESERRFKIASEQVNIYYWEYTVATKQMRPCFRCMRDLGLPALVENYPEPAIEMGIFPADYADMYRDWHRQIEAGVKQLEADIPLTVGRVPFRVRYTTEFDENGKPYKAYGSATLISERELKKNKLDSSIIETLSNEFDGIFLIDLENDTFESIKMKEGGLYHLGLGNSYTEAVKMLVPHFSEEYGESLDSFIDPEKFRNEFFKDSDRREINFRSKCERKWVRMSYKVVERSDDAPIKLLLTYYVIDDHKAQKLDDDRLIAKQKAELEERQKELTKAVNEANRANNAKSDFLARMSHEIRTPMNAIMGMNELILKEAKEDSVKGYAGDAYRASKGLLEIINEILDFSKIESGKMELVEDNYRLGNFFGNLYTLFGLRAEDKNLALVFEVDETLPRKVFGDEKRIRQVLVNLLSNAVKYTEKGTVTFKALCEKKTDRDVYIRYEVIDTGRGIKKEDMGKLLEAFERIDEKDNKNIEGTGLGMNIAVKLLEMMGSKLEIESEYGKGSSFAFTVRQEIVDELPVEDYRNNLEEKESANKNLFVDSTKTILVVDDNAVNLKVISALLRETKMTIVQKNSGKAALDATAKEKFDLIFLDHYMPEMDGMETLEKLKNQNGPNGDTPVIVLTANAIKGATEEYRNKGFSDVVFKPTTQKELNRVLWKFLA